MGDLKRWFKVWTAILGDDDFDPQRSGVLEAVGRFTILGAFMATHGKRGVAEIHKDTLFRLMNVTDLDTLRCQITLKNVHFEEGKNRYGKVTVTWEKWRHFQEDSTTRERQKTLRSKRRGEEKRGEEKRIKEKDKEIGKTFFGEFKNVKLTDQEHADLVSRFGPEETGERIERLSEYLATKDKRYKNHKAVILAWARKDKGKEDDDDGKLERGMAFLAGT